MQVFFSLADAVPMRYYVMNLQIKCILERHKPLCSETVFIGLFIARNLYNSQLSSHMCSHNVMSLPLTLLQMLCGCDADADCFCEMFADARNVTQKLIIRIRNRTDADADGNMMSKTCR